MLPAAARMRRREDFRTALRGGRRVARGTVVLALLPPRPSAGTPEAGALVGFAVGRTVGGAVTRNRVVRRLRHLMREQLGRLPPGSWLVVRALPPAGSASHTDLRRDLDSALGKLLQDRR
jgi:ribonuclease P protein component